MAWAQAITPVPTNPILATVLQTTLPMMDRDELLAAGDRNLASTMRLYATTAPGAPARGRRSAPALLDFATWPGPYHNGAMRLDPIPGTRRGAAARAAALLLGAPRVLRVGRGARRCRSRARPRSTPATRRSRPRARPAWPSTTRSTPGLPRRPPASPSTRSPTTGARLDYLAVTVDAYADSFLPRDAAEAQLATLRGGARARRARRRGPTPGQTSGGRHGRIERGRGRNPAGGDGARRPGPRPGRAVSRAGRSAAGFELGARRHRARGVGGGRAPLPAPGIRRGVALPLVLRSPAGPAAPIERRPRPTSARRRRPT